MADRSDENKKEFSIEELNAWNVEKLRKYLKNRGVVITTDTRKRDLVSKVYHACRLDLPLCSTKEQDDAQIKAPEMKGKAPYRRNLASSTGRIGKLGKRKP